MKQSIAFAIFAALVTAPLFAGASAPAQADGSYWTVMPPEVCASQNNGCGQ
jgi:hypothetical protein